MLSIQPGHDSSREATEVAQARRYQIKFRVASWAIAGQCRQETTLTGAMQVSFV